MRRLKRSGGLEQVTPDAMLARRGGAPCSVGKPVSEAREAGDELFTLFGSKGSRSVFDRLQIDLKLSDSKRVSPQLEWGSKIWTVTTENKDYPKSGMSKVSLFTETRKMACPSFSLPAGPTYEMGTCPAANHSKKGGLREEGKTYTCDGCYSLEGNYIYMNVALAQAVRLFWVRRSLEKDPSGALLASQLVSAIENYATRATLSDLGSRLVLELGVQMGGRLMVPVQLPEIGGIRYMPVNTPLPPESGFANTDDLRAYEGVPEGAVTGFFRIHDSGDFGVASDPNLWKGYLSAWVQTATALPHVRFWAPTRMWMWKTLFREPMPPNLSVRPSSLHVDDAVPTPAGLAVGSTVLSKEMMQKANEDWGVERPGATPFWPCPVYGGKESERSCMGSGCRACWLWKNTGVAYGWH